LVLTWRNTSAGIGIIIAGIAFFSFGSALTTQTPEPDTGAEGWLEGLAEWSRNVGIAFAKGLGVGLQYVGYGTIAGGIGLLIYWYFR